MLLSPKSQKIMAVKAALPKAVDNADCNRCYDLCKHGSGDG